jgi:predicted ferric reductase
MTITGLLLVILYIALACTPAMLAALIGPQGNDFLYELGKSAALTGLTILFLQIVLSARWKWTTRPFGLDIVLRYHRNMAVFAGFLLVVHPLLLAAGGYGWGMLLTLDVPWFIWVGKIALAILLLNLLASGFRKRLGVTFERWRCLHNIFGVLLVIGIFVHSWYAGSDLQIAALQGVWIVLLAGGLAIYIHHRFIRPTRQRQRLYQVTAVNPEAEDVWTLELEPPEGESTYAYLPGQFHFFTLYRGRELPTEEHHFTISSSPTRPGRVTSTIKAVGDFTSTIGNTKVGDQAAVQGAFGRFSYRLHPEERDLVFIVGGIGITPLMSMLRSMRDEQEDYRVLLLYGNRNESSIVFRDELAEIEAGDYPQLQVAHILSDPDDNWTGLRGFIDRDVLDHYVGNDISGKVFYVCGPAPLMTMTLSNLKQMGVKDGQIRNEIFALVD